MTRLPLLIIQKEVNVIIKSDDALRLDVNVFYFVCLRDIDIFCKCHFPHISDENGNNAPYTTHVNCFIYLLKGK